MPMIGREAQNLLARSNKPVAVLAPIDYNGILFARALRRKGVKVLGVFPDASNYFYHTNSCAKVVCNDVAGPGLIALLEELGSMAKKKPVLVPIGDLQVLLFSQHRERLARHFTFNIPSDEAIAVLIDKVALYAWGHGSFLFPKTCIVQSESDLRRELRDMAFPVVFKPKYRNEAWLRSGLPKAVLCDDSAQVLSSYETAKAYEKSFLVSEYIPGGDDQVYESHVYYSKGRLLAMYVDRKLRQYPPLLGTGSFCISEKNERVAELTVAMLERLQYSGIGGFEFKRDNRSGEYYVIDPSCGRPCSHCYIGLGEGFNLPYIVYRDLAGMSVPRCVQTGKRVGYVNEEADLESALHYIRRRELSWAGYLRSLSAVRVCVHFSWFDPWVGVAFVTDFLRRVMRFCRKHLPIR
jgi:predicted ATP-grasp superfamily ATP-dependent carboligase